MKAEYKKSAVKYLKKLPRDLQLFILREIEKIPNADIIPMSGKTDKYRLRAGKYRVIFEY